MFIIHLTHWHRERLKSFQFRNSAGFGLVTSYVAGRLSFCYATLHWHDSRALNASFPRGTFLWISTLDGNGTNPKLTLSSRIRKLSSKNTGIFRYNPLSIKGVIPYILLACQNHRHSGVAYGRRKKSVATASRSRWRHSMRQTSSVWGPVFVLYCFWILLATGIGSPGSVGQFFTSRHSRTSCEYLLLR